MLGRLLLNNLSINLFFVITDIDLASYASNSGITGLKPGQASFQDFLAYTLVWSEKNQDGCYIMFLTIDTDLNLK